MTWVTLVMIVGPPGVPTTISRLPCCRARSTASSPTASACCRRLRWLRPARAVHVRLARRRREVVHLVVEQETRARHRHAAPKSAIQCGRHRRRIALGVHDRVVCCVHRLAARGLRRRGVACFGSICDLSVARTTSTAGDRAHVDEVGVAEPTVAVDEAGASLRSGRARKRAPECGKRVVASRMLRISPIVTPPELEEASNRSCGRGR